MHPISSPTPLSKRGSATPTELGKELYKRLKAAKADRVAIDKKWDFSYAMYRASPEDMKECYSASFSETGSTKQWKHRINTGKTFEIVETLVAYLKGATFPSDDWFDVKGLEPNLDQAASLVKELGKFKMEEATVRDSYSEWYRNLIIFGCSTFRVGWSSCVERKATRTYDEFELPTDTWSNVDVEKLVIDAVSPYDVYLTAKTSLGKGGTFTRLKLTPSELAYYVAEEYYDLDEALLEDYDPGSEDDDTEIFEYYGPLVHKGVQYWCIHAVFFGQVLIRLADSTYWCGSPYITGVMIPDRDSVYGMTVLDPSSGALHILNVLTNSRLDNIAVSIDKMFTMVEDGITRIEDVYTQPGKIFKVAQHDAIRPIDLGPPTFTVGYQEASLQEQAIDRNCATGPLIGAGQSRGGERVTAQEILAVQTAGGNRLTEVHTHIEDSVTTRLLTKVFTMMQQYVVTPQLVAVFRPDMDTNAFFSIEPDYLSYPYSFKANGAAYVVEKERSISDLMKLFDVAGRVPQLAEKLNFNKILGELLKQMRFTNPQSLLNPDAPEPEAPAAGPVDLSESLGGDPAKAALQNMAMDDGGASLLANVGVDTSAMDPALLQQMSTQVTQGIPDVSGTPV